MLFDPLTLRGITIRNRAWLSPMCQHSADEGHLTDWHLVHLGSRAVGGAGLIMVESTAVHPDGRISPYDTGLWSDAHIESWSRIARFLHEQGATTAVQLSHAGRKASTNRPWDGKGSLPDDGGGWPTVAPSTIAFGELRTPQQLSTAQIHTVVDNFRDAARRANIAGYDIAEVHAAHGYLLHQFLSTASNTRSDEYGGSFENRVRFPLQIVDAVRDVWPADRPVFVRVSATDWVDGGWDINEAVEFAKLLRDHGVDLIDTSSGGNDPSPKIRLRPGYQVPFARRIREQVGVPTAAVGLITEAVQAEEILRTHAADAIMIARAHLDDPYWVRRAALDLGAESIRIAQYDRPDLGRKQSIGNPGPGRGS